MDQERILVVDDDEDVLYMIVIALKQQGYEVERASNGLDALEVLERQGPFSILLTDLMMPGMSGLALLHKAHDLDPNMEVVIITAAGTLESAIAALRADGAYDYLLKPFESMNQLSVVVERAIAHRRLLMEQKELHTKIQREADWLRALVSNTTDAILAADAEGKLSVANPAALRLLKTSDDILGKPANESLPPLLSKVVTNWQAVGRLVPAILELLWSDGSIQSVNLNPVMDEIGNWLGWAMVMSDISHLRRLDEMRTRMMADTVQKIRLPMAQVLNDLVELDSLATQDPRLSELSYHLMKTWEKTQTWLNDALSQSQVSTATGLQSVRADIPELINQAVQNLEAQSPIRDRLEIQIEPALPNVVTVPELLQQVIQGLLKRALLRNPEDQPVHIRVYFQSMQIWIEFKDDGAAVKERDLPHLFEKTFVETGREPGEVGVNLADIKATIEQLGSQIWVGGQEPLGSCILICLPVTN